MNVVAIAKVGYEKDPGVVDSIVWFEPGEEVKGAPKDVVDQWLANGSVGEPTPVAANVMAEKEELEARVAELEKQLEDAKKSTSTPAKATPTKSTP